MVSVYAMYSAPLFSLSITVSVSVVDPFSVVRRVQTAKVTAHNVASADGVSDRTVFLIKFSQEVRRGPLPSADICILNALLPALPGLPVLSTPCGVLVSHHPVFSVAVAVQVMSREKKLG